MKISGKSSLSHIKADFQSAFPYLKVEFYLHGHGDHSLSPKSDLLMSDRTLSDVAGQEIRGDFEIFADMTVEIFESSFFEWSGLGVQVFRNSNGVWLQTSSTDSWTLEKQNGKGERSGSDYPNDPIGIADFDVE